MDEFDWKQIFEGKILHYITIFLVAWSTRYLYEKGKNRATKEDIGAITEEVESVKTEYTKQLEILRASLRSRGHIHEVRYQKEFEILVCLSAKLAELRDSALSLRPEVDIATDSEEDRKRQRLKRYSDASWDLIRYSESHRPFFDDPIYDELNELTRIARLEAVQYSHRDDTKYDPKYWEQAEVNAKKIRDSADRVIEAVRYRVRSWEDLNA